MRTRGLALNRGTPLRARTARTISIPAPVGGLNARDAVANMKPTDAVIMDNWVPGTASVALRKGYTAKCTGFTHPVETVASYREHTTQQLFAVSNGSIYDISIATTIPAASASGYANSRFQCANFSNAAGDQFLYMVNGANTVLYDGTTFHDITTVSVPYAITGVDPTLFKDVQVYGRRLWFTEANSFRVWYLDLEAISGVAKSIDFGPAFLLGGSLAGMVVWTVASELSTTSYAVFVSTMGECIMYSGYDPDDPTNFILAGSFRIGKPIGQRFWERVGTDTILLCEDGLMPISKAAINNRQSQSDAISYKIINLVADDIDLYRDVFGWQAILYPEGDKIIVNVPRPSSADTVQYVMNTLTNQWCRYKGLPSYCWALFDDDVYFGSDTAVYLAEDTYSDNGAAIASDLQPAYSYFGATGTQKMFTAVRPVVSSNGAFSPSIGLSLDFSTRVPQSTPTLSTGLDGSLWNVSPWNVSSWGGSSQTYTNWQSVGGIGFAAALRIKMSSKDMSASMQSIDYAFEVGTGIY